MFELDSLANPGTREYLHALTLAAGYTVEPSEMSWAFVNFVDTTSTWVAAAATYAGAQFQQRMLAGLIDTLLEQLREEEPCYQVDDIAATVDSLATAVNKHIVLRDQCHDAYGRFEEACQYLAARHALQPARIQWRSVPLMPAPGSQPVSVLVPEGDGPPWPRVRAGFMAMCRIADAYRHHRAGQLDRPLVNRYGATFTTSTTTADGQSREELIIEVDTPDGSYWTLPQLAWHGDDPTPEGGSGSAETGADVGAAPDRIDRGTDI